MFFETLKEFVRQTLRGPLEIPLAIVAALTVTAGLGCLVRFFTAGACILFIATAPAFMFSMGSRFFGYARTWLSFVSLYTLFLAIFSACLPAFFHYDHHAHSWSWVACEVQIDLLCLFFLVGLLYWLGKGLILWSKKNWSQASKTVHTRHHPPE